MAVCWKDTKYIVTNALLSKFLTKVGPFYLKTGDIREALQFPSLETAETALEIWALEVCESEGLDQVAPVVTMSSVDEPIGKMQVSSSQSYNR